MENNIVQVLGWVPALIFPLAAVLQLHKIRKNKRADGVSVSAWIAFGFANLCLYGYTEKYSEFQTIIGMVGQAIIDFSIAGFAIYYIRLHKTQREID